MIKRTYLIILLTSLLTACNQNTAYISEIDVQSVLSDVDVTKKSLLKEEFQIKGISIGSDVTTIIQALGEPDTRTLLGEVSGGIKIEELRYGSNFFIMKEGKAIGLLSKDPSIETKAGIMNNDAIDNLLEKYPDDSLLHTTDTYFLYDEHYLLTFEPQDGLINEISLFKKDTFLELSGSSFENLLLKSTKFESPTGTGETSIGLEDGNSF